MEHNGKVLGESLDLIKYVDSNFEGPSLWPEVILIKISIFCAHNVDDVTLISPKKVLT